jgi:hypothetical protein
MKTTKIEIVERSGGWWLVDDNGPFGKNPGPFNSVDLAQKALEKVNQCGKCRTKDNPYEVYRNASGWEWRVLKKYQSPEKEAQNPLSRWFCFVTSQFCPHGELGDTYIKDIKAMGGVKVS